jgi:hypothetical protein
MNVHPIAASASPSLASPLFDASFDSIESLTTSFAAPALTTLETKTVTEVALGYHRNQQYSITAMTTSTGAVAEIGNVEFKSSKVRGLDRKKTLF